MTCRPLICFTITSWRNTSSRSMFGCRIWGVCLARSYSVTRTGLRGSVMSTMSTWADSSLSTMTAYALLPSCQAKTLWVWCTGWLRLLLVLSPKPCVSTSGAAGLLTP